MYLVENFHPLFYYSSASVVSAIAVAMAVAASTVTAKKDGGGGRIADENSRCSTLDSSGDGVC